MAGLFYFYVSGISSGVTWVTWVTWITWIRSWESILNSFASI